MGARRAPRPWMRLGSRCDRRSGSRWDRRSHASWLRATQREEEAMPSANKMTTPVAVDLPEIQGRYAELDGYTVGFESYPEDVDPAPLFRGLPDDRRQPP